MAMKLLIIVPCTSVTALTDDTSWYTDRGFLPISPLSIRTPQCDLRLAIKTRHWLDVRAGEVAMCDQDLAQAQH
jgi:hypothetical protein